MADDVSDVVEAIAERWAVPRSSQTAMRDIRTLVAAFDRVREERDAARAALDSIGDMLIEVERSMYHRLVSRCIEDAKWRKEPEFSERPESLRGHILRVERQRDEAREERDEALREARHYRRESSERILSAEDMRRRAVEVCRRSVDDLRAALCEPHDHETRARVHAVIQRQESLADEIAALPLVADDSAADPEEERC